LSVGEAAMKRKRSVATVRTHLPASWPKTRGRFDRATFDALAERKKGRRLIHLNEVCASNPI
jgi:hypothetical protein